MAYTHREGEVIEVRTYADPTVTANNRLRVTRFNQCRIRWPDGSEEFRDCRGVYSQGDRIAFIYRNKRYTGEINLTTGAETREPGNGLGGCLIVLGMFGPLLFGLFLLYRAATHAMPPDVSSMVVPLGVICVAFSVGLVFVIRGYNANVAREWAAYRNAHLRFGRNV